VAPLAAREEAALGEADAARLPVGRPQPGGLPPADTADGPPSARVPLVELHEAVAREPGLVVEDWLTVLEQAVDGKDKLWKEGLPKGVEAVLLEEIEGLVGRDALQAIPHRVYLYGLLARAEPAILCQHGLQLRTDVLVVVLPMANP